MSKPKQFQISILILLLLIGLESNSQTLQNKTLISGKVVHIVDGDTYDLLLPNNQKLRIRIEGIDAPERGMPFYSVSKNYLGQLCLNKQIRFQQTGKDTYKRALGFSYLPDNKNISAEMIRAGMAWHFKRYNKNPTFANLEVEARKAGRGLWQDKNPTPPWEKRNQQRKGITK